MDNHTIIYKQSKIIFASCSSFGLPSLEKLFKQGYNLTILTKKSYFKSRGKKKINNPILDFAKKNDIELITSNRIDQATFDKIISLSPSLMITASYGVILPQKLLSTVWVVNLHASLLPKLRGPNPIRRAIELDYHTTGVCLVKTVLKIDAGPIYASAKMAIDPNDNFFSLNQKLADLASDLLSSLINQKGYIEPIEQDINLVSYAEKFDKKEAYINSDYPASLNLKKILALSPKPYAKYSYDNSELLITLAKIVKKNDLKSLLDDNNNLSGPIPNNLKIKIEKSKHLIYNKFPVLLCKDDGLMFVKLIVPGKKEMTGRDFLNGYSWRYS